MTFGGLPTRWEPEGESRGLGLLLPGRADSPAAPLLDLAQRALLQHGFTVQQVWWDSTSLGGEDVDQWVRRVRTAEIHVEVARAIEDFLSGL
jgi:hypothetical protein